MTRGLRLLNRANDYFLPIKEPVRRREGCAAAGIHTFLECCRAHAHTMYRSHHPNNSCPARLYVCDGVFKHKRGMGLVRGYLSVTLSIPARTSSMPLNACHF